MVRVSYFFRLAWIVDIAFILVRMLSSVELVMLVSLVLMLVLVLVPQCDNIHLVVSLDKHRVPESRCKPNLSNPH
jgi:hypothetical protein